MQEEPQGRSLASEELHDSDPGCSKMKGLARHYLWWLKMDAAIEQKLKQCQIPPLTTLCLTSPMGMACRAMELSPFLGLILVDAHSKWLKFSPMKSITSSKTTELFSLPMVFFGRL